LSPNFDITKSGRIWNGTINYNKNGSCIIPIS
jgi:hypothetical protein